MVVNDEYLYYSIRNDIFNIWYYKQKKIKRAIPTLFISKNYGMSSIVYEPKGNDWTNISRA